MNIPLHIRDTFRMPQWQAVVVTVLSVLLIWGAIEMFEEATPPSLDKYNIKNFVLFFTVANVFISGYFGLICGLITSLSGVLIINYYYIYPSKDFRLDYLPEQFNIIFFIITSVLVAAFTANARIRLKDITKRENQTQILYKLNEKIAHINDYKKAVETLEQEIAKLFHSKATVYLPGIVTTGHFSDIHGVAAPKALLPLLEKAWSGKNEVLEGNSTAIPMIAEQEKIGIIVVHDLFEGKAPHGKMMLRLIAYQAAMLIERMHLSREMQDSRIREEREKLRSMLLSSVSHDLKTPLASIIGSLSVFHSMHTRLSDEKKLTLTQTALDEAQRLDSFISNILDITRLESGAVTFRKEWFSPLPTVQNVLRRMRQRLRHHTVNIVAPSVPFEIEADTVLTEQITQNLLDNAAKYTPVGSVINVTFTFADDTGHIIVSDTGMGIPEDKLDSVFDKYARLKNQDSQVAGTGLGLAIAKTIMEAQGGTITASNNAEGGATFTLRFPARLPAREAA